MATPSSAIPAVEAAISRVLDAERAAHDDVARATRDAAAIVEDARAIARAIAERTERRIRTLRDSFESAHGASSCGNRRAGARPGRDARTCAGRSRPIRRAQSRRLRANSPRVAHEAVGRSRIRVRPDLLALRRASERGGVARQSPSCAAFRPFSTRRARPPFRRWISGIAADAGPHAIEAALVGHWRALVDELREWMPERWHAALSWAGTLVDLPVAEYFARGGDMLPWMQDDPRYRELGRNPAAPPTHGPLAPLAAAWTDPEGLFRAWCGEWSQRVPRSARDGGIADRGLRASSARAPRARSPIPRSRTASSCVRAWSSRLSVLYRRATLDPAAAFIFLALSALDMERLRGELLRRAIFPAPGTRRMIRPAARALVRDSRGARRRDARAWRRSRRRTPPSSRRDRRPSCPRCSPICVRSLQRYAEYSLRYHAYWPPSTRAPARVSRSRRRRR